MLISTNCQSGRIRRSDLKRAHILHGDAEVCQLREKLGLDLNSHALLINLERSPDPEVFEGGDPVRPIDGIINGWYTSTVEDAPIKKHWRSICLLIV